MSFLQRPSRSRIVPTVALTLLALFATTTAECQEPQRVDLTVGALYLNMLETTAPGVEAAIHWPLPFRILKSESAIGFKLWHANLDGQNSWMNKLSAIAVGAQWRSRWTLVQRRLRAHVSVPVQLLAASERGLQDLSLCELTEEGEVCEVSGGAALAIGAGAGLELRLIGNLYLNSSINGLWSKLERTNGDPTWYVFLGVGLGLPSAN